MSDAPTGEVHHHNKANKVSDAASGIFCCGPHYDEEVRKKHQLLRVPRCTTDGAFLTLFAFYSLFMMTTWIFAVEKGKFDILVNGMDWRGSACGAGELATKPKQLFINPLMPDIWTGAVCVAECPQPANNAELNTNQITCICNANYWPAEFGNDANNAAARSDELITECDNTESARDGYFVKEVNAGDALLDLTVTGADGGVDKPCAYVYRSSWASHKCTPWISDTSLQGVVDQSAKTTKVTTDYVSQYLNEPDTMFSGYVTDAALSAPVVGYSLIIAVVLSTVAVVMLQYSINLGELMSSSDEKHKWKQALKDKESQVGSTADVGRTTVTRIQNARINRGFSSVAGMFLVLEGVMMIAAVVVSWTQYKFYKKRVDATPTMATHDSDEISMHVFLVTFVVLCVGTVVSLGMTIMNWKNLNKAASIVHVASSTFGEAPQILLYPIFHSVAFGAMLVLWLFGAIMIYCAGDIVAASNGVADMEHVPYLRHSAAFYLFGLIWFAGFMNGMGYMIVAGVTYLCTFADPKNLMFPDGHPNCVKDVPAHVMTVSSLLMIRYHMGSAAKGSLMLSTTWIFRELSGMVFRIAAALKCCGKEMLDTFNCLMHINKMAFLQTVLHGFTFCDGSYEGNRDVYHGREHWAPTTFMSSFVLVSIKVAVSLAATAACCMMISSGNFGVDENDLTYYFIPYLLTFAASYVLATAALLIFEVAIDAMMVAFCEAHFAKDPSVLSKAEDDKERGGVLERQLPKLLKEHMGAYGGFEKDNEKEVLLKNASSV